MSEIEPITREEILLNSIAEETGSEIQPITRKEMYLSAIAGETDLPADMNPITREEIFLQKVLDNGTGGGGEAEGIVSINITQNGTITRNVAQYASAEITTNVPTGITPTGTLSIQSNGNYDVTNYASVEVNTLMEKVTVSGTAVTQTIDPNKFYVFGEVTSLAITLGTEVSGYVNEFHFRFTSGSTEATLSLPSNVTMPSDFTVEANKTYEISIIDNYGTVTSW